MKWFLVLFVIGSWQGPLPVNGTAIAMPDQKTCEAVQAAMTQPKSECWAEDLPGVAVRALGWGSSGSSGTITCGILENGIEKAVPCQ